MSVESHLVGLANDARLSQAEWEGLGRSATALGQRVDAFFGTGVRAHFAFGSAMRGTNLPRSMDPESDVDYMVVFADGSYQPQTYLDRLRRLADKYYPQSQVAPDNPAIVLELNHIKFDLVPAVISTAGGILIPAKASANQRWLATDPVGFNDQLAAADGRYGGMLKPMIRVLKYWNALNGYVYASFELEQALAAVNYQGAWTSGLRGYFSHAVGCLNPDYLATQWRREKVERLRRVVEVANDLEVRGLGAKAEAAIQSLLP